MAERYQRYSRKQRGTNLAERLAKTSEPMQPKERAPYDPAKQAEGIATRLEGSGLPVEQATDTRSFVERSLNLTEDQNFLFDVLEVLGRPQQALFGGIQSKQKGQTFWEGFKNGLSGNEYTRFAQVLNEAGIGEENTFGLDDVLGFAGDIFLDPADLAIIAGSALAAPATGGASIGVGAAALKATNTAQAVKNTKKVVDTLTTASQALRKTPTQAIQNVIRKANDGFKATSKLYKEVGKDILSGKPFRASKKLISGKTITLGSGERLVKQSITGMTMGAFRDAIKISGKSANYLIRTGIENFHKKGASAALAWDDALKSIEGVFNKGARLGDKALRKVQSWVGNKKGGYTVGTEFVNSINDKITDVARRSYQQQLDEAAQLGQQFTKTLDDVKEEISRDILTFGELEYMPETSISEILNRPTRWEEVIDEATANRMRQLFDSDTFADVRKSLFGIEDKRVFDDLFQKSALENGQPVYYFKNQEYVEKYIDAINNKFTRLYDIVSDEGYDLLRNARRFAQDSNIEKEVRRLIEEARIGKTFEDIFKPTKNGMWSVRDADSLNDLMKYARAETYASAPIPSPRFRTEEEFEALRQKFAQGFNFENDYREVLEKMEDAMRFFDEKYQTAIFKETKGYIHHAATADAKDALNMRWGWGQFKTSEEVQRAMKEGVPFLIGNTKSFAGRKYAMSVTEANRIARFNAARMLEANTQGLVKLDEQQLKFWTDKSNIDLFSEYVTDSFSDSLIKMNEYGADINIMDTALVRASLESQDVVRKVDPLDIQQQSPTPFGFERVPKEAVRQKLEAMALTYTNNKPMKEFVDQFIKNNSSEFLDIDKNVYDMINRLGNKQEINALVKALDFSNAQFKKLKIFSFGFHFKNLTGNASNLYLAGVPAADIPRTLFRGLSGKKQSKRLLEIFAEGGEEAIRRLPQKQQDLFRAYEIFMEAGFEDAGRYVYDLDNLFRKTEDKILNSADARLKAKKALSEGQVLTSAKDYFGSFLQLNIELNSAVDTGYRLGFIRKLLDDGLSREEIIRKVKSTLFDPSDLTAVEKSTLRRVIPFYTFAKKNLAFQMRNLFDNPVKYKRFVKSIRGTWEMTGIDWEEELQSYQRDNLWLPIPWSYQDGKYQQLKTSFPAADLGEFIDNPVQKILSSMAPYIKAPFELATNREIYSGLDIERFEGQRGRDLPFLSARGEYALEQTGLERFIMPAKNVFEVLSRQEDANIIPSITSRGDVETARRSQSFDSLNQLRDLLSYYKQENIPVLTLAEIENINKPRASLAQRLQSIQSRRSR